jgi:hypothetical protein
MGLRVRRTTVADEPKIHTDESVTSHNQSGGITARNVNIGHQPGVTGVVLREAVPEDGGYVTEALFTLQAGYAANRIRVEAAGEGPIELKVQGGPTPQDVTVMFGVFEYTISPSHKAVEVSAPLQSAYRALVRTNQPEPLEVGARLT